MEREALLDEREALWDLGQKLGVLEQALYDLLDVAEGYQVSGAEKEARMELLDQARLDLRFTSKALETDISDKRLLRDVLNFAENGEVETDDEPSFDDPDRFGSEYDVSYEEVGDGAAPAATMTAADQLLAGQVASTWGRRSVDRGPDGGDGGPLDYDESAPSPGSPFLRRSPEEYAAAKLAHLRVSPNSVLELKHAAEAASLEESYAGAQDRVKDRTLPPTISSEMFYGSSHDSPLHPSALDRTVVEPAASDAGSEVELPVNDSVLTAEALDAPGGLRLGLKGLLRLVVAGAAVGAAGVLLAEHPGARRQLGRGLGRGWRAAERATAGAALAAGRGVRTHGPRLLQGADRLLRRAGVKGRAGRQGAPGRAKLEAKLQDKYKKARGPAAGAAPAGIASRAREVCEAPAAPGAVPKCYVFETPGERPAAAAGYARAPPAPGAPAPYGPLHPAAPITMDAGRG